MSQSMFKIYAKITKYSSFSYMDTIFASDEKEAMEEADRRYAKTTFCRKVEKLL